MTIMKNKYQRLDKAGKKQARLDFKNSESNRNKIYEKGTRLKYISIAGFLYSIITFGFDLYYGGLVWNYILDAVLLIFCFAAYFAISNILDREINKYLINRDKKPQIKDNKKRK